MPREGQLSLTDDKVIQKTGGMEFVSQEDSDHSFSSDTCGFDGTGVLQRILVYAVHEYTADFSYSADA